jgi:hypothetical protein
MNAHSARMATAFQLGALAVLLSLSFAGQSIASAPAAGIDPSRARVGNIVYPPGVQPPPAQGTQGQSSGTSGTGTNSSATTTPANSTNTNGR